MSKLEPASPGGKTPPPPAEAASAAGGATSEDIKLTLADVLMHGQWQMQRCSMQTQQHAYLRWLLVLGLASCMNMPSAAMLCRHCQQKP
jgi:hypothetical protein